MQGQAQTYSTEQFKNEIVELRQLFGERIFWTNPDRYQLAVKGLLYVYFRLDHEPTKTERTWLQMTLDEGERRMCYMMLKEEVCREAEASC